MEIIILGLSLFLLGFIIGKIVELRNTGKMIKELIKLVNESKMNKL